MEEIFKILVDFPAYRISNLGRIQSRWKRGTYYSEFKSIDVWKDLPTHDDGNGYKMVHLCDGYGKHKTKRIHNLVTEYFIGLKPKDKDLVRHLDNNKNNNIVTNLAYGTYWENEQDKIENGTWNTRRGGAKITPSQVKEIRIRVKNESQESLAKEYNVSRPTITRIANKTIWKEL